MNTELHIIRHTPPTLSQGIHKLVGSKTKHMKINCQSWPHQGAAARSAEGTHVQIDVVTAIWVHRIIRIP